MRKKEPDYCSMKILSKQIPIFNGTELISEIYKKETVKGDVRDML